MKPAKDLRHPLVLLLALFSAEVLAAFELAMLYPALKVMVADFGDVEAVGWVMTVWIKSELHAEVPLIDVRLLANRQVLLINLGSVVLGLTSFQSMHVWSIVLQQPEATGIGLGASATISGLALLPKTLIALVAGPVAGWLISRYSGRVPMAAGSIVMTAAWIVLIFKHDSIALIAITLTFLGLGMSTFYACIPILIAQSVPMHRTSEASGMMIVIRATAMGIGAQVIAVLLNSSTQAYEGANYPDETALTRVLLYVIAGTVLQLIIALRLKRKN